MQLVTLPVSYTHLDVYKRQVLKHTSLPHSSHTFKTLEIILILMPVCLQQMVLENHHKIQNGHVLMKARRLQLKKFVT